MSRFLRHENRTPSYRGRASTGLPWFS
jgi:hypothetical protein